MIITRSPLRITLGGGGTDLPSYYRQHGVIVTNHFFCADGYRYEIAHLSGLMRTRGSLHPGVIVGLVTAVVEAVVSAAQNVGQNGNAPLLRDVAGITNTLTEVSIPVGWAGVSPDGFGWWAGHLLGWGLTAVLVMVGAPFWFELLERLITFKSGGSGGQPARADQDPAAATPRVLARDQNPSLGAAGPPGAPGQGAAPESELMRNIKHAVAASAPPAQPASASAAVAPSSASTTS